MPVMWRMPRAGGTSATYGVRIAAAPCGGAVGGEVAGGAGTDGVHSVVCVRMRVGLSGVWVWAGGDVCMHPALAPHSLYLASLGVAV